MSLMKSSMFSKMLIAYDRITIVRKKNVISEIVYINSKILIVNESTLQLLVLKVFQYYITARLL